MRRRPVSALWATADLRRPQAVEDNLEESLGRVRPIRLHRLASDHDRPDVRHIAIGPHRTRLLGGAQQLAEHPEEFSFRPGHRWRDGAAQPCYCAWQSTIER